MSRYAEVSKEIMAIFRQYDPNMLASSVDEAYIKQVTFSSSGGIFSYCLIRASITEYCAQHNLDSDECVGRMRQRVFDETKLTVSAGIAANKVCLQPFPYLITDFHRRNFRC
jgi:DNA polymerase kappa